jgi:hypothetical protein
MNQLAYPSPGFDPVAFSTSPPQPLDPPDQELAGLQLGKRIGHREVRYPQEMRILALGADDLAAACGTEAKDEAVP